MPETAGGLKVTTIRNCALDTSWRALTTVTLPDSVTEIGSGAFSGCENLAQINLPPHLETIGSSAFSGCGSLTEMTMPDSLRTIGMAAFNGCYGLTALNLNEGLESVGGDLTVNCNRIARINIPSSLSVLPEGFLHGSGQVRSIVVPENVKEIENDALDCGDLLCVFIPASAETVDGYDVVNENTIVFTPQDSAAMRWALSHGRETVACDRAEDMPVLALGEEGDFSYATLGDEAIVLHYNGESAEVTVPATLGGCPVTRMGSMCFFPSGEDFVTSITLPESVNHFACSTLSSFDNPLTLTIPAMEATFMEKALGTFNKLLTVVSPEGSSAQAYAREYGCAWRDLAAE